MDYRIIIVLIVILLLSLVKVVYKKFIYQKILILIRSNKKGQLNHLFNKLSTKLCFSSFELDNFRLNDAIINRREKDIENIIEKLEAKKLYGQRAKNIYSQAYNYYLKKEDFTKVKRVYEKILTIKDERFKNEFIKSYHIFVEKGYQYLDEMLEQCALMPDEYKGVSEYLISVMYSNKGDKEKSKEYLKLSEKHLKLIDDKTREKYK